MHLPKYSAQNHPLFNCGNMNCPICAKAYSQIRVKQKITSEHFSSQAVAPFIGRFGYPHINVGVMAPVESQEESWMYDAPKYWAQEQFAIPQIVEFRSSLINSKTAMNVKKQNKFLELNQEVALASLPVDVDINLKKKPVFRVNFDSLMAPSGPQAQIKDAKLTQNPKIHTKVQKVHYASDMKASDALVYLYENKFDENFLSRMFSVGTVGIGANRKLVPTRWSITATDDTLGKHLLEEVKEYQEYDYAAFFGSHLGNYYLILCFPQKWSYELFEMHVDSPNHFMSDFESFDGRKAYAASTAGGYYSVRLAVLEHLQKIKRQGSFLALRFITGDYTLPLGVWVTREAARNTLRNKPIIFGSKELLIEYCRKLIRKKFSIDADLYLNRSKLLREINHQSRLAHFF